MSGNRVAPPRTDGPWQDQVYLGRWCPAATTSEVRSPGANATLGTVGLATTADVPRAVELASSAQVRSALTPGQRGSELTAMAALIRERSDEIVAWLVHESGSSVGKAQLEVALGAQELDDAAELALMPRRHDAPSSRSRSCLVERCPLGVVGVITPFNFPFHLALRSVAPALAMDNAVVVKPHPLTAISGGALLAELARSAGLPSGLLHVLPGGAKVGAALVAASQVAAISFTGAPGTGLEIGAACTARGVVPLLELGGNNVQLVLPGVDVGQAARCGATGSFYHQGQICMSTGRHLVHESCFDEYVAMLTDLAMAARHGDPTDPAVDIGPLISAEQLDRIERLLDEAESADAQVRARRRAEGLVLPPAVVADRSRATRAWREEIFGPVAVVAPFGDADDVVAEINAGSGTLSLSVLTTTPKAAFNLVARARCGMIHINGPTVDYEVGMPFGGWHRNGNVALGGHTDNAAAFSRTRWITTRTDISER